MSDVMRSTTSAYDASYPPSLWEAPPGPVPSTASITALAPNTAVVGAEPATVAVNGTGFTGATVIRVNGTPVQTSFVSPTQLTTTYFATAPAAVYTVTVIKPGELPSNSRPFTTTAV